MSLSARTIQRLCSFLGPTAAADLAAGIGGGSAFGPPIDFTIEGTLGKGPVDFDAGYGDDFALVKKVHLPTDAKLYFVTAQIPAYAWDDAPTAFSGGLTVIENAAHWDHWFGDGSNFEYPTADAMSVGVTWPGGGQGNASFNIYQSLIAGAGWYVVPANAYITSISPIA